VSLGGGGETNLALILILETEKSETWIWSIGTILLLTE
jgi:hypothetical protein